MDLIEKATQALILIILARLLGPSESGALVLALGYQSIFQAFTLAGTNYLVVREVAKNEHTAADYFVHMIAMKIFLAMVSWSVLLILISMVFHYAPSTNHVILVLALAIPFEGIGEVERALFLAYERLLPTTIVTVIVSAVKLLASYVLLEQGGGSFEIALVFVLASGLASIANLMLISTRLFKPVWKLRWEFFRVLLPNLRAFASMGILRVLEYNSLILILSYVSGERSVGIFGAAYTIVLAILLGSQAYASGAMPIFSRLYAQSHFKQLAKFYQRSVELILVVAFPIMIVMAWFSSTIIFSIYTPDYAETVRVLQVLSLTIPFGLFLSPQVCIMLATNRQKTVEQVLLTSFVVNIFLAVVLIPPYMHVGASFTRLGATATSAILYYLAVRAELTQIKFLQLVRIPAVAGAAMIGTILVFRDASPWLALFSSCVVYLIVLVLFAVFLEPYRRIFSKLVRPFRA